MVFGIDSGVLVGELAALRFTGMPKPAPIGDWQARRAGDAMGVIFNERFWAAPDVVQEDGIVHRIDGQQVPIRTYRCRGSASRAVVVYVHGGGLIAGNIDIYDSRVSAYVQATGITFVSVAYALAPEHPFPRAHDDILAVIHDVWSSAEALGFDRTLLGIAGDSAGGGLAAAVALRLRDERRLADGPRLACQLLVYPMLDNLTLKPDPTDPNMRSRWVSWTYDDNATGWGAYLGDRARDPHVSPYAAPARATDLSGLPPTFIDVGTLDIFLAEDAAYADALRAQGVDVRWHCYPAVNHGFDIVAPKARVTRTAWQARFDFLRATLS